MNEEEKKRPHFETWVDQLKARRQGRRDEMRSGTYHKD